MKKDLVATPLVIKGDENLDNLTLEQLIDPVMNKIFYLTEF